MYYCQCYKMWNKFYSSRKSMKKHFLCLTSLLEVQGWGLCEHIITLRACEVQLTVYFISSLREIPGHIWSNHINHLAQGYITLQKFEINKTFLNEIHSSFHHFCRSTIINLSYLKYLGDHIPWKINVNYSEIVLTCLRLEYCQRCWEWSERWC